MKKNIIIILLSIMILKADIGDWKTFCSISQGNDLISSNNKIYVATDGGMLEFNGVENNIYDTDNGLYKINTTAVASDFRNIIWAGHSDCSISLFDENGNSVGFLNDIEEYGSYELNHIYSSDNYVYVATDQILVRYSYNSTFNKYDVTDSNLMTGNVSDIIVHEGNIYMSTTSGIYMIPESNQNIGYLDNWTLLTGFDTSTIVNKFLKLGQSILALSSNGIYSIDANIATKESIDDGAEILWGAVLNSELYYTVKSGGVVHYKKISSLLEGTEIDVFSVNDKFAERFIIVNNIIYYISKFGFSSYSMTDLSTTDYSFNLPAEKGIKKIKVTQDNSKLLYLTSRGFREFDIFTEKFREEYYTGAKLWQGIDILEDNSNNIYVTTWSTGVFKFNKDYNFETRLTFGSAILPPSPYYPYATHPGICKDKTGNLWITNFGNLDQDSTIVKIETDGTVIPFTLPNYQSPYNIFVDDNDWVWIGSSSQQFNERDGLGVSMVQENSLIINNFTGLGGIIDINKDSNGLVWIGTNNGIKYIDMNYANPNEPSDIVDSDIISIVEGPVGNMIYDIEVSEINEKWFATDKGVSVLSQDNIRWRHYVPKSYRDGGRLEGDVIYSALPDNAITDIELDSKNGIAIFSSYNGITLFEGASLVNREDIPSDEIVTIPSPFINDGYSIMTFVFHNENYNSAKIFDLNGRLVKGGTGNNVFSILNGWNGRDNNGKIVSTGIYQVVAYNDSDPTIKIIGKIAVVRK
ncbi:MAG: hypothetical protein PF638_07815 [Candidatus Delongbacteria bacterium]|jgi:succinate dehydrogenase flavin-adding protein (antitoxin of CptAB toxin-antitoxin module)|nr:hypothetical protein [Candidatus Delongbacteria bacterium]